MALEVFSLPTPNVLGYTQQQMIDYGQEYAQHYKQEIRDLRDRLADVEYELQLFRMIAKSGLNISITAQDMRYWKPDHNEMLEQLKAASKTRQTSYNPDSFTFD